MSVIKYLHQQGKAAGDSSGKDVHFHRVERDGLPFRGKPPMLKEHEYEDRLHQVADAKNGTFYTGEPSENAAYLDVLDKAANKWFRILFIDRWRNDGDKYHHVYVEWLENYLEDRKPGM
jgi:hypothetical protein